MKHLINTTIIIIKRRQFTRAMAVSVLSKQPSRPTTNIDSFICHTHTHKHTFPSLCWPNSSNVIEILSQIQHSQKWSRIIKVRLNCYLIGEIFFNCVRKHVCGTYYVRRFLPPRLITCFHKMLIITRWNVNNWVNQCIYDMCFDSLPKYRNAIHFVHNNS